MSLYSELNSLRRAANAMPASAERESALDMVRRGFPYDRLFFSEVNDAQWLPIFKELGFFKQQAVEGVSSRLFSPDLPLLAVARLAERVPEQVTTILTQLDLPKDAVADQVLRCVALITDKECIKRLSPVVAQFASVRPASLAWIEEVLKNWLKAGALREVLTVVEAFIPSVVEASFAPGGQEDAWMLGEIDEKILASLTPSFPDQVADTTFRGLVLWADKERQSVRYSENREDYRVKTPSTVWLEDFKKPRDTHREIEATLAYRLFACGTRIFESREKERILAFDERLRSNQWELFKRLRWQVYADFPEQSLDLARRDVVEILPLLGRIDFSHGFEFAQMLAVHARRYPNQFLTVSEIETLLSTVLRGPTNEAGERVHNEFAARFQRKQIEPLIPLLRESQLEKVPGVRDGKEKLDLEAYKPFRSHSARFVKTVAPIEAERLSEMDDVELWNFINNWAPSSRRRLEEWSEEEDYGALGRKFAELVSHSGKRFSPTNQWWENITRPEIIAEVLEQARPRLKKPEPNQAPFPSPTEPEWDTWFGVAEWILRQTKETAQPPLSEDTNAVNGWTSIRIVVAMFIRDAVSSGQVPVNYASRVRELVTGLIEGHDPRLDNSSEALFDDWLTAAINSARGDAFQALLEIARQQKNANGEVEAWISKLIESRLKSPDESPAIFALVASHLRLFVFLFGDDWKEKLQLLFPVGRASHCAAAIEAHFTYDNPWTSVLRSLPNLINLALATFKKVATEQKRAPSQRNFGVQLGTHIAFYHWNGAFRNDAEGVSAFDEFFAIAPKAIRAQVLSTIAGIFKDVKYDGEQARLLFRAMELLDRRVCFVTVALRLNPSLLEDFSEELREVIDLFECECFPFEWRLLRISDAFRALERTPRVSRLLRAMSQMSDKGERLGSILDLLKLILSKPSDELRWSIRGKEVRPIIARGLKSENADCQTLAGECRDLLLRMGFFEFLDEDGEA